MVDYCDIRLALYLSFSLISRTTTYVTKYVLCLGGVVVVSYAICVMCVFQLLYAQVCGFLSSIIHSANILRPFTLNSVCID